MALLLVSQFVGWSDVIKAIFLTTKDFFENETLLVLVEIFRFFPYMRAIPTWAISLAAMDHSPAQGSILFMGRRGMI